MPEPVKVWYMTEEQRLSYIAEHPIKPSEEHIGVRLSKFNGQQVKEKHKSRAKAIDGVDTRKLHKLFMKGEKLRDIASVLNIKEHTLSKYISQQRKVEPDKWPLRTMKK